MKRSSLVLSLGLAFALGCSEQAGEVTAPPPSFNHEAGKTSAVTPTLNSGNFAIADNQQLCFAAFENTDTDLTGLTLIGIKIDPVGANFNELFVNGGLNIQSAGGIYLNWTASEADGVKVLGIVVKGGNNFNFYDYINGPYLVAGQQFPIYSDNWLHSPEVIKGKKTQVAEISHLNFCVSQDRDENGCTPGYWRNHADRWQGVAPGDDFDATFDVDAYSPDITLGQAIQLGGGGVDALARHATAALLNAHGGVQNADGTTVAYPYTVQDVLDFVKAAIDSGDAAEIEATKDLLAAANELGCPLTGTRSNPVP